MTEREKLIELVHDGFFSCYSSPCERCKYSEFNAGWCQMYKISDYLISNGIVIPVRCEDCKHHNTVDLCCEYLAATTADSWYCWNGERRDKE